MLSKSHRLPKDFFKVEKKYQTHHSPHLILKVHKREKKDKDSRFSFTVSSGLSPGAVKRNLLKRRAYNIIKEEIVNIKKGCDCHFIFKKIPPGKDYLILKTEIKELLKKASIYKLS